MITLNGTLGTGLYWGASKVLSLGGPIAVVAAFSAAGILAWTVMQGVSEMLMIWRIRGAIPRFVAEFVDQDLGIAVGIAYWSANPPFPLLPASSHNILSTTYLLRKR